MGGFGSGRPGTGRSTVEACRSIDVNRLHKAGCLQPGWAGGWQWTRDGTKVASIELRAESSRLHLSYRVRTDGGDWRDVTETVPVVRVSCPFGGTRPYFVCPGVVNGRPCDRRVAKVYGAGQYFVCRHCYRLVYSSQREGTWDRAVRRAGKIRGRIGGDRYDSDTVPRRPKGMWRRTYNRLRQEIVDADTLADEALAIETARLLARVSPKAKRSFWP
jgi:hypothetical protein